MSLQVRTATSQVDRVPLVTLTDAEPQADGASGEGFAAQCVQTLIASIASAPSSQLAAAPDVAARLSLAAQYLQSSAHSRAAGLIYQVLEKEPESAMAYAAWGLSLFKAGDVETALMAFDSALMLDEGCLPALGGKILLLALQGNQNGTTEEARALGRLLRARDASFAAVFQRLLDVLDNGVPPEIRYLNIGGGPNFQFAHWRNLEAVASAANPEPFHFTPTCEFPLETGSLPLVYSSHCIEHLDDPTVDRVLAEARRVVQSDGALVLKIPDFDRIAEDWRRGEPEIICAPLWGLESLQPLWQRRGVMDNVDTRAAMIFCGFWNDAYAGADGHFAGEGSDSEGSYHGPPPLDEPLLSAVFSETSPHAIAGLLRQRVVDTEPSYHFNHQNAWSRQELDALLVRHGFKVLSFDGAAVMRRYRWIPEIAAMDTISTYCFAVPR